MKHRQRVLYITGDEVTLLQWHKGRVVERQACEHNDEGRENFLRLMREDPELNTHILIDVIEEEYYNGNMPKVSLRDRKAFLERQKKPSTMPRKIFRK